MTGVRTSWLRAVREARTGPHAKVTAVMLSTFMVDGVLVHPGNDVLARAAEVTERTVRRHLATLEAAGLIARVRRQGGDAWELVTP